MDLVRFEGKGIHGYIDVDIHFNEKLTFLTGINGSGKTTALNCIVSLLFPKLQFLCDLTFDYLYLEVLDGGTKKSVWCERLEEGIELACSESDQPFSVNAYLPDPSLPSFKRAEHELEYYSDLLSAGRSHPFMQFISELPTPMYLGLDRRIIFGERSINSSRNRRAFPRRPSPKTSAFANSLEASFF